MIIRLYSTAFLHCDGIVELDVQQSHYVVHVMRRGVGDEVCLFNNEQGQWRCVVQSVKKGVRVVVGSQERVPEAVPYAGLVFAPLKRTSMELMGWHIAEMGVSHVWPVASAYAQTRYYKASKLHGAVVDGIEQTGRLDMPVIHDMDTLAGCMEQVDSTCAVIFLNEAEEDVSLWDVCVNHRVDLSCGYTVLVGPEGGFSEEERAYMHRLSAHRQVVSVHLGQRILRAPTAVVSAFSFLGSAALRQRKGSS